MIKTIGLTLYHLTKLVLLAIIAIPMLVLMMISNGLQNRDRARKSGL